MTIATPPTAGTCRRLRRRLPSSSCGRREGKRSSRCDPRSPTGPRPSPPRGETESPAARGIRAKRGPGWASSAGFCTAIAAVAVPGHFPLRGLLPRSPRTPWGCPPPPPPRCGLLAPSGHPTSPPPPAILAIRVPSRSFLIVLTHTWGRTHRDRSGWSPRVPACGHPQREMPQWNRRVSESLTV